MAADPKTPSARADLVDRLLRGKGIAVPRSRAIPRRKAGDDCPLSLSQQRLLFLAELDPQNPAYNLTGALRLQGHLDVAALERSFTEIVRRHEVLRTTFTGGLQVVSAPPEVQLVARDLEAAEGQTFDEALRDEVARAARRPFDLARGPVFRVDLLRLADTDHVLVYAMHHIVSDAWSMGILVRELGALYRAFTRGEASPLPELSVQYADHALWQQQEMRESALDRQITYWKERLASAPRALDLPADRPRPSRQTFEGDVVSFSLSPALSRGLHELCKREGVTLYVALLAAFDVLLSRYTGRDDIVVGSPYANRTRAQIEPLIGFFVNTLAMRVDLSGDPTFREVLGRAKETALGAFSNAEAPFERVVQELAPPRDPSRTPLFQVSFTLEGFGAPEPALEGLTLLPVPAGTHTSKFDLTLTVVDKAAALHGNIEYATALFDRARIERMTQHLEVLLESAVEDPSRRLGELSILPDAERRRVLVEWNATEAAFPLDASLSSLIEAQVDRTPDAPALSFEDRSLTYAELDQEANRVARGLSRLGAGPGTLAGVLMERSIEMVVAILGILKSGAAYVPLDPEDPPGRLAFMLGDASLPIVLTQERFAGLVSTTEATVICLDANSPFAGEPAGRLPVSAPDIAYAIYTSGSTGRPKGALNTHQGVVNRLLWMQETYRLTPGDRVLQKTPVTFDVSVWELFWPLLAGAEIVVARPGGHRDPAYLADIVRARGITTMHFVPSMLAAFLEEPAAHALKGLRRVFCSGEALSAALRDRFFEVESAELENLYGPTEAAVDVTAFTCRRGDRSAVVPIGRPVANTQMYVLDARLSPVPEGVPGELCIGGVQVGRGYLNRPELSAERFVGDPFRSEAGVRLYRTGDLGRFLPDGNIEFLGRLDDQVKIRGVRIELGEIEAALERQPAVRRAVVAAREDSPGDRRLVAYVVPDDSAPTPAGLEAALRRELPEAMVPSSFVLLDALPLTPSGKVDRRALPAPGPRVSAKADWVAPRTAVEEVLAAVWADVCHVERVSIHDDFFELGGHSLLAAQLVTRASIALGVRIPLRAVFEGRTVAAMAHAIEEAQREDRGEVAASIPRGGPPALSFGQERLWFLAQLEPSSAFYNLPLGLRLEGALDTAALERAFREVIRRHEILRTTYASAAGRPIADLHDTLDFQLPLSDLSALPEAERDRAVRAQARAELERPFDLARGPLLRALLVRLGADDHALIVTLHHMVVDAWTIGVLVREITALHGAFSRGEPSPLAELPLQYADYARWQRTWLSGEALAREMSFWTEALRGAPTALDLPTDRPRPAVQTFRGSHVAKRLSPELSAALRALCRKEGATLYMAALAVFGALLQRYTGQDDILIGTSRADRRHTETEGLIGYFLNQIVLRTRLSGDPTFRELLARVRETALAAYAHQDLPFERLVETLRPGRHMSRSPVFQVMVDSMRLPAPPEVSGLRVAPIAAEVETSRFDLTLSLAEAGEAISLSLEYSTDLFDRATAQRMLGHLEALFERATADPSRRLSELDLLTKAERESLARWNDTARPERARATIHGLIELAVQRTPDAVAVRFREDQLTYRELDARANRLAHRLIALGAGPEVPIAICVSRSLEMVIGVLGILKSGAAYVPFDPAWPSDRLAFLLEDTAAPILLTEEAIVDELPALYLQTVCLDADWPSVESEPDSPPPGAAGPENLAYVIYTSGSTGKPKGVLATHDGLVCSTAARLDYYEEPVERFLLLSSFAFDSSMAGIYWTLLQGGTIVLPEARITEDPRALAALVASERITHLLCVPSLHTLLLAHGKPHELSSLRAVIVAGESAPADTVRRHHELLPGARLYNEYGPTEATVWCTVHETAPGDTGALVPIGKPIAEARVHLLDAAGRPVPIGVPGELFVGGGGVTRGYLKRAALTAERFVPDPFSTSPGARLYRTGDLGRYLPDGAIEFLGRIDRQVKIRGYRIELEEIESALRQLRDVLEAVVLAREDTPGDVRLIAYFIPSGAQAHSPADLRGHLERTLPDYMIPSAFVALEAMPLLPNGKVDRKALPAPDARASVRGAAAPPRSPVEDVLATIWADVLGTTEIGIHDDFFELGGHSLLATQVMARLAEAFHVEIPLHRMFDAPTVAALASAVEEGIEAGTGLSAPPLEALPRGGPLPLSFGQERLWVLDQMAPGNPFYNLPGAIRLTGHLDVLALSEAIAELARRHESLRSTFLSSGERPSVTIRDDLDFAPAFVDATGISLEAREAVIAREIASEAARPFDLARGPLARARLLRLSEGEHVLVFTLHHIVADAWSMGVLVREIGSLYQALADGEAAALPALAVQYADHAAWQRRFMQGETLRRELAHWREALSGAPLTLDLPTDRPRPVVASYRGAQRRFTLSPALSREARGLCRREGVTLHMLALAAFSVVLQRWSRQEDMLIGTSVADRRRAGTEPLIGYFLNQLVLRATLTGDPTFRDLLGRIRQTALAAYAHQDLPFEKLVEELRPSPDLGRAPLFQVMVDVANAPAPPLVLPALTISAIEPEASTARFDLTLSLSESGGVITGSLEYATDLFDASTIERMTGHLETLLEGACARPEAKLSALPLLGEEERRTLLVAWNDTRVDYPRDACVHRLFEEQVDRTPDATAVVADGRMTTYRELDERANRLARYLAGLGVGPGVLVGLALSRTPELLVGILGVLKAGGAYVPLDPGYPIERLAWMLEDSMVPVVLTEDRLAGHLPVEAAAVVRIDAERELIDREAGTRPDIAIAPESLAYVIYTSGSTGRPKGVMVHHRGLVNYLSWAVRAYEAASGSGAPVCSSVSFDLTITSLFAPLLAGKAVTVVPEEGEMDALAATLEQGGYSLVKLTPAHVEVLSRSLSPAGAAAATNTFVIGGEALSWEALAFLREHAPRARLINEYGPTETVVGCCVYDASLHCPGTGGVPIGRPIANTRLYVLDAQLGLAPIGAVGELYIGGDGVGRGYWNRPDLTGERFLPDPFAGEGRMYRTGDLVRYRATGDLEFLGRLDEQVKLRGHRIELGEIEAALRKHPSVREATIALREAPPGNKALVGYYVPREEPGPAAHELRSALARTLPDYMVPSAFVALASLPLTANGKVDRKALPAPDGASPAQEARVAPRTSTESALAEIFREVLGAADVGVFDDFFELGGHSLLATQVLSRVRAALQVDLPFRVVFEARTVASLGQRVDEARGREVSAPQEAIPRLPRDAPLPLSFAQERLWFLDQLEPDSASYNVPEALRVTGALDVTALESALREVVQRHEILRMTVATEGGRPRAEIHGSARLALPVLDLTSLPAPAREAAVREEASREARLPFRLATGPLARARLLRTAGDEHVLLFTTHHLVSDAWSFGVLLREVTRLYEAFVRGDSAPAARLPELPVQYADYAAWQRGRLDGPRLEQHLSYWRAQLAGLTPLDLPLDRPRPPAQTSTGARVAFTLRPALATALAALCRREAATPFMAFLTAFQITLGRYAGQDDVAVGTPVALRDRAETEGMIGLFLNTLVLRADLSGQPTFRELLRKARDTSLGAQAHASLPFERLVDALAPERDMSRTPLFQALFVLQNAPPPPMTMAGLELRRLPPAEVTAKLDLALAVGETESGWAGAFEYSTDLFDASTIERFLASFLAVLTAMIADASQPAHEASLLSDADRQALLVTWNGTRRGYRRNTPVHELVAEQARRKPGEVAVVFEGGRLTYGELESRSNRLARYLARLGVRPGALVALAVPRSHEMVIALLGVLKAGGAYVPLDPEYPDARLAHMLDDAHPAVLLTSSSLRSRFSSHRGPVAAFGADDALIAGESDAPLPLQSGADDRAYVIYTSGSTGRPKGVEITHGALTNFVQSMQVRPGLVASDRLLAVTSLSFDIAGLEVYVPLSVGASIDVVSREVAADGEKLAQRVEASRATVLQATPATWRILLEAGWKGRADLAMLCGGEALSRALAQQLLEEGAGLWNMFGPTETTIWSSIQRVTPGEGAVPLGEPIANTRLYVLDARLGLAPIGAAGELYIGGDGLAAGYLNRRALTAERFVPSPFGDGERLYRTGDRVRRRAGGELEFLGRVDFQVKVRGHRIELGEIEAALAKHTLVRECVVVVREASTGDGQLVAYLVAKGDEAPSAAAIRAFLRGHLPDYMVPSVFVALGALPLTLNGKVDRRALPAPDRARADEAGELTEPLTRTERVLADAWRAVLGRGEVGVHDNFFELGGDSIRSIQVVSRAREAGVRITPRQLFQHQTIAELAEAADKGAPIEEEQGIVTGPVPLTPFQRRWAERGGENASFDSEAILLEAPEPVDPGAMERAFARVLEHHDALRTRWARTEQGYEQRIDAPGGPLPYRVIDATVRNRVIDVAGASAATVEEATREARATLSLESGPAVQLVVLQHGVDSQHGVESSSRLLVVLHRMVVDGASKRILLEDLWAAYEAERQGWPVRLPEKTTSFKRWAERLSERASSPGAQDEVLYRLSLGAGLAPLPADDPGGGDTEGSGELRVNLDDSATKALLGQAQEPYGTQVSEMLLTALAQALARWTGSAPVLVLLEADGREGLIDGADVSRTVGCFTSCYPVRLEVQSGAKAGAAIKAVKEQLREGAAGGLAHEYLRGLSSRAAEQAPEAMPEPRVIFRWLGRLDQAISPGVPRLLESSPGSAWSLGADRSCRLEVTSAVREGKLEVRWAYGAGAKRRQAIQRLAEGFMVALEGLIDHCLSPEAGGYTPSDFKKARVSQETLDMLAAMDDEEDEE